MQFSVQELRLNLPSHEYLWLNDPQEAIHLETVVADTISFQEAMFAFLSPSHLSHEIDLRISVFGRLVVIHAFMLEIHETRKNLSSDSNAASFQKGKLSSTRFINVGSFSPAVCQRFESALLFCSHLWYEPFDWIFPLDNPETALKNEIFTLIHFALVAIYTSRLELRLFDKPPKFTSSCLTKAVTFASEMYFLLEDIGFSAVSNRAQFEYSVPTIIGTNLLGISFLFVKLMVVRVVQDWFIEICKAENIDPSDSCLLRKFEEVVGVHGCDRLEVAVYVAQRWNSVQTRNKVWGVIPVLSKETVEGAWREDV